jgi:hypothetical protein
MATEITEPLLSHLQAGPFIIEAKLLVNLHNLHQECDHEERDLLLGPKMGSLTSREALYCMTNGVSRLSSPCVPSGEDYWIRETIIALYRGFAERFLASFPEPPEEYSFVITSLLHWLMTRHAVRSHSLSYQSFGYGDWDFIINDIGMMFLEQEFPEAPRRGPLLLPPAEEWESKAGWLEDVADQLMYCLPTAAI